MLKRRPVLRMRPTCQSLAAWARRLAFGVLMVGVAQAQDWNPWAAPDQRPPPAGFQAPGDSRFVGPDYNPAQDQRRRGGERARPVPPGISWGYSGSFSGGMYGPPALDVPEAGTRRGELWSPGTYGIPGLSTYPGGLPYGGSPGGSMLYPGTGLGMFSPLYGSPLGGVPLFGVPY